MQDPAAAQEMVRCDGIVKGIAGSFTWFLTALGAAVVFLNRRVAPALLDAMLGFAAGAMIDVVVEN